MTAFLLVSLAILAQAEPAADLLEPLDAPVVQQPAPPPPAAPPPATPAVPTAPVDYPRGTVLYVNATSLALRAAPKRDGILIHYMPQQSQVTVLDPGDGPVSDTIGDKAGRWIHIQHGNHAGYAFDAFLIAAPPALEENLDWVCVPGQKVGPITSKTTYSDLVTIFGAKNIGEATIPLGDGKTEAGTVIFADNPDQRLFIQWAIPRERPHAVIVEGSRWKTSAGIGIGTPISEIIAANGGEFSFAGFGWDYAGYVVSWKNGQLAATHRLGEDVSLFLAPDQPYLPADIEALQGDKEFSTTMPEATRVNLRVKAMTVLLRQ